MEQGSEGRAGRRSDGFDLRSGRGGSGRPALDGEHAGSPTGAYGPFECKYVGATPSCSNGGGAFSTANFSRIFRGDVPYANDNSCAAPTATQRRGLCHFLPGIRRENVVITYTGTGLGYQARVAGAVPTITVELRNVDFQFFFVGPLLDMASDTIAMPTMLSTVTGEDLKSTWSSGA